MNREAFIDRLAERLGDRSAARAALEAFIAEARSAAAKGETISVAGLLITYPAPAKRTSPAPAKKATKAAKTGKAAKAVPRKSATKASTSPGPGFPTGRNNPVT